ncbi:hypothetical protein E4K10_49455 [Streptomyces sp. T1317-0309]|nr:hypothetical protein E4K10_49455 [Streptomyces sp. T1317-0309]
MRNPHVEQDWAHDVVRAPQLLAAVQDVIGPNVAVENTFLVTKWPDRDFEVPWHQDGINHRLELDPHRSVAAWVALTDADESTGCVHVIPGSQRAGYLPFEAEADTGAARGRALGVQVGDSASGVPVTVPAGSGLLMDTRLVHCSHSNTGAGTRIGLNIRFVAPGAVSRRQRRLPGDRAEAISGGEDRRGTRGLRHHQPRGGGPERHGRGRRAARLRAGKEIRVDGHAVVRGPVHLGSPGRRALRGRELGRRARPCRRTVRSGCPVASG